MFNKNERKQYLGTFCVNIIAISCGATAGWPSPSLPILQSSIDYPLKTGPLTIEEGSWVNSMMCIGGFIGTIIFGFLANCRGRKISLCILAFPQLCSCLMILCTQNIYYLLVSRFLAGVVCGGTFVLIPLYIAEISDDKIRGTLSSKLVMFNNAGTVLVFVTGDYLSYFTVPILLAGLPLFFLAGVLFLPETPFFLMMSKKEKEAEISWRYYHGLKESSDQISVQSQIHLEKLKNQISDKANQVRAKWKDFCTPVARRAFVISLMLICLCEFTGFFALLTYTATIFEEAGTDLTPNLAATVVGIFQLIGSYVSTILVDRIGRKTLLLISYLGTGLGLIVMGFHSYLKVSDYDVSNYGWVPIASFSFMIFVANCGVLSLPFVVMSEVLPEKIRDTASTICMSVLWVIIFHLGKYFPILTEMLALHGILFLFSGFCFGGVIFVAFFVPETKGKSFDEIMQLLK